MKKEVFFTQRPLFLDYNRPPGCKKKQSKQGGSALNVFIISMQ